MAGRTPRPAGRNERRVRHRRHDGQLHGPRRGASRGPREGRLGRRAARPAGCAHGDRRHARRDPRHGLCLAPDAGPGTRGRTRPAWSPRTTRAACDPTPCARRCRASTARSIVCAQAGNVNTGAFDPLDEVIPIAHEHGAWVHIDGAFGIWAAAVPSMRDRMRGHDAADSWSTDAHKWLNVPYDSGLVFVRDAAAHHAAMTLGAAYYVETAAARTGQLQLGARIVPASARVRRARCPAVAGSIRPRRPDRAQLQPGATDGGTAFRRTARHDPQRRRAQPGPGPLRGPRWGRRRVRGRCAHQGAHRRGPARRDVLAGRDDLGRSGGDARFACRAGRRPRPTSTARPMRSSAASPRSTADGRCARRPVTRSASGPQAPTRSDVL